MNTPKGRILNIPAAGITITDEHGKVLAKHFIAKLTGTRMVQTDPSKAPVKMATLKITKADDRGSRQSYNIERPMQDVIENLPDVLLQGVGDDCQFERNDPYSKLLIVLLSAGDPDTEQNAKTYNTTQFVERGCWFYASDAEVGKQAVTLAASAEVEVVREIRDEKTNEISYRCRVPREDGSGHEFCTVSKEQLQAGQFSFSRTCCERA